MKRSFLLLAALLMAASLLHAQFGGLGGVTSTTNKGTMAPAPPKKAATTRSLTGLVMNQNDDPLDSAVVYLKDARTLNIRTYISNKDGSYQFNGLQPNQDYEIYAEYKGERSNTRTLSSFDSRPAPVLNLRIEIKKKQGS